MRWCPAIVATFVLAVPAGAQVIRDGSIGPPATGMPVAPGVDPTGELVDYLITEGLGEVEGTSLYHSFGTFSVGAGEVASFTGGSAIDLVVARVTSSDGAFLNGTLRSTLPNAEIFFLSPGGLVIGEGTQLDVPRSIHFGTADTVRFGVDPGFDLPTGSLARPLVLSSAPPSAFGFGPDPETISVGVVDPSDASRTLSVLPGAALSLVGGDVTLTGVPNTAPFFYQGDVIGAPGATVQIASAGGNQDVPLTQTPEGTRLDLDNLPADALDGSVLMQLNARIDVGAPSGTGDAAGGLVVRAGSFTIADGRIEATHRDDGSDAGSFDIGVRDGIALDAARITSATAALGRGSDVSLTAAQVAVGGASLVRMISTGAGDSGDFTVVADDIAVVQQAEISSISTSSGAGGAIRLAAMTPAGDGSVTVAGDGVDSGNGSRLPSSLASETRGAGPGGAIAIEADLTVVTGNGDVLSTATAAASTAGGAVSIRTADLLVEDGSRIATLTQGAAPGGAITVEGPGGAPAQSVMVRNAAGQPEPARVSTNTTGTAGGAGPGGALAIRSAQIDLQGGGQVFARTEGSGDAGSLDVDADVVRIQGVLANPGDPFDPFRSGITSRVGDDGAEGSGTLLSLDTRILEILDGGQVSTATFGIGDAGTLQIVAGERMTVQGGANGASRVSASAVAGPTAPGGGEGGLLSITAGRLELLDGGQVTASTTGAGSPGEVGDAGDVVVVADALEIRGASGFDQSGIFSRSNSAAAIGVGDGGDISLTVAAATIADGGLVEVSSSGDGNGGSIRIDVGDGLELDSGGRIQSSTEDFSGGMAGSVTVDAGGDVVLSGGSRISAATGVQSTGAGGVVTIVSNANVILSGASGISSSSGGFGDAGDIVMSAHAVLASQGSAIETQAGAASGGSIDVAVDALYQLVDASTTTSVQGMANTSDAGNVLIRTPGSVVVNDSTVVAQAVQGQGGRIEVTAGSTFVSGDSLISASSQQGPQGVVEVTPPENALLAELSTLPAELADPSRLLASDCEVRTEREGSFTVRTRADAAAPPDQRLDPGLVEVGPGSPEAGACEEPPAGER